MHLIIEPSVLRLELHLYNQSEVVQLLIREGLLLEGRTKQLTDFRPESTNLLNIMEDALFGLLELFDQFKGCGLNCPYFVDHIAHAFAEIVALFFENRLQTLFHDCTHEYFVESQLYALLIENLYPFVLILALVNLLCWFGSL